MSSSLIKCSAKPQYNLPPLLTNTDEYLIHLISACVMQSTRSKELLTKLLSISDGPVLFLEPCMNRRSWFLLWVDKASLLNSLLNSLIEWLCSIQTHHHQKCKLARSGETLAPGQLGGSRFQHKQFWNIHNRSPPLPRLDSVPHFRKFRSQMKQVTVYVLFLLMMFLRLCCSCFSR
ncbi:hypothetical protein FGIG_06409 [Fasciola gigantica]|uniref:Uncharacterized protein n=1 Tax=Fasciola gigantica TaxID=46835 RepID=A0A504Y844_FASGI|nr:hypothetical protein FGIG_06409 [Fasciola gigantica]